MSKSKQIYQVEVKDNLGDIKAKARFKHQQLVEVEYIEDVKDKHGVVHVKKGSIDYVGHKHAEDLVKAKRAKKL